MDAVQAQVAGTLPFHIKDKGEYALSFPTSAVIQAEKAIGRSLTSMGDWFKLTAAELPEVLVAGLQRHNPEVELATVKEVCEELGAEGCAEIKNALLWLNWPKTMRETLELIRKRAKDGTSPNV